MYDPMIAKLIVWDSDREQATHRMVRALGEYEIGGLKTLLPFHDAILQTEQWARGETCRDLIEDREWLKTLRPALAPGTAASAAADENVKIEREYTVEVAGKRFDVRVIGEAGTGSGPVGAAGGGQRAAAAGGGPHRPARRMARNGSKANGHTSANGDSLTSPLQGTVFRVAVEPGAEVQQGSLICVIEAMKMENEITAHKSGVVTELAVAVGASVSTGDTLAVISGDGDSAETQSSAA
jgi:acetyl-CoA/propionyl-CoA carboxylase biotin carboxyl carrier protein